MSLQNLLDQLNSRDLTVQADALRDVRALPPDELLRLFTLEKRLRRTRRKRSRRAFIAVYVVLALLLFCLLPKGSKQLGNVILPLVNLFSAPSMSIYTGKYNKARRQLISLLYEVEDVRFVPYLWGTADDSSAGVLRDMLKRLLPQVRADHAALWSKEDRAMLLLPLKDAAKDPQLALACLKALEQIGDRSAISAVKKFQEQALLNNWQTLCKAATECLLYLESNAGKMRQGETLLRPSDAGHVRPDILLRAASAAADNSTGEQLLRPGTADNAP